MTDPGKTLIAALLDHSGSMSDTKHATEDGWRELIDGQRGNPGHCQVTLAHFNTDYGVLYPPTDIAAVPEFTVEPGGGRRCSMLPAASSPKWDSNSRRCLRTSGPARSSA